MKIIKCKCGRDILVDDSKYEELKELNWSCFTAGGGPRIRHNQYDSTPMGNFIIGQRVGFIIDHKDTNDHNNQKGNLRHATQGQNCANRAIASNNTSGFKGVTKSHGNKWKAEITVDKKRIVLGTTFNTPEEASIAYDKAALEHFGEFSRPNNPFLTSLINQKPV